jgi:methionyl-tRNA formyltransferase
MGSKKSLMNDYKPSIIFFGTPSIASHCLNSLIDSDKFNITGVVTNPDRPSGRGKLLTPSPVKSVAASNCVDIFQTASIKKDFELFKKTFPTRPDIGVVVAFGQILSQEILDYPIHGCVNLHASLLPKWRGASPINKSIIEGDSETGVGLMKMEIGLDTGPVFCEVIVKLDDKIIASELHDKLAEIGAKLLVDKLPYIINGTLKPIPQINLRNCEVSYASKISNEECKINWALEPNKVIRHIHGLSYTPGAFTTYNNLRFKIYRIEKIHQTHEYYESPGTIVKAEPNNIWVSSVDKNLCYKVLEGQIEGKKKFSGNELFNSANFQRGLRYI